MNKKISLKKVNKLLIVLVLLPLLNTLIFGTSIYTAEQNDDITSGFTVQSEALTEPVVDVGTLELDTSINTTEDVEVDANTSINTTEDVEADANTSINTTEDVEVDVNTPINTTEDVEADANTAAFVKTTADAENAVTTQEAGVLGADNTEKESVDAGEETLEITTPTTLENQVVTYELTDAGNLEQTKVGTKQTPSTSSEEASTEEAVNELQVYNGKIISADEAIASTIGGVDQVVYAYENLEEAKQGINGIPLSGGAYDAKYVGTEQVGDDFYAHITISGLDGYMDVDDIQIIPSGLVKSQSHYENINGDWVYFEATDPLQENSYLTYAIDVAPAWAQEGVAYYSYDDQNFTTTSIDVSATWDVVDSGNDGGSTNNGGGSTNNGGGSTNNGGGNTNNGGNGSGTGGGSYYSYFQNLPFNSTSNYTGAQYKSYLKHKGYTNSQYYNDTNAFVEAQSDKKVNSLYLFAMANHESLYGTSEYAQVCNNFFGYGAYDSNPDNACGNYGYLTPRDGILAQGYHLEQQWGDLEDVRWAGEELGNKSHGVNVYYASDPDWGKKIAEHMYDIDSYLGGKENGYYRIYEITSTQDVYSSYSNNKKLKIGEEGEEQDYQLTREDGNPRVIVTGTNSDYFEFQLPTPKNNSSDETCTWSDANSGSYPNYGKTYSIEVDQGTASFACDYDSWSDQQGWYPAETSSGSKTYKVISDASPKDPGNKGSTGEASVCNDLLSTSMNSNGDKVEKWGSKEGNEKCTIIYYGNSSKRREYTKYFYNPDNDKYRRIIYRYDSSSRKDYYADTYYSTSTGYIKNYTEYYYNNDGKRVQRNEKIYASDGDPVKLYKYYYNSDGKRYNREYYEYDSSGKKMYYVTTKYSTTSGHIVDYKEYFYDSKGTRVQRNEKYYKSNGNPKEKRFYYYDSKGNYVKSKKVVY